MRVEQEAGHRAFHQVAVVQILPLGDQLFARDRVPGSLRLTGSVISLSPEEIVEFFRVNERAAADLNER
jgi:hypothetical protein